MDLIDQVIQAEGPDTNDPDDPGGLTRFGIAQNRHPDIDVAALDYAAAKAIYRDRYLTAHGIDRLPNPPREQVFDWGVNQGPAAAVKALQGLLGCKADGYVGPLTLHALASKDARLVNNQLVTLRQSSYRALVAHRPSQKKYLAGWLARAKRFYLKG